MSIQIKIISKIDRTHVISEKYLLRQTLRKPVREMRSLPGDEFGMKYTFTYFITSIDLGFCEQNLLLCSESLQSD